MAAAYPRKKVLLLSLPSLPPAFVARILARDPNNGQALLDALEEPRTYALRANTLKISPVDILHLLPFHLSPVPWCSAGYYYGSDCLLYTSPSPRDGATSRMPSSA